MRLSYRDQTRSLDGGLVMGRLQITGSYSLHFENTTELDKYKANTKNALIVTFTGALIGSSSLETIQFKLGRLILTSPPVEYNIDGLLVLNQEFEVEYEATDLELTAIVINNVNNASTRVYDKAIVMEIVKHNSSKPLLDVGSNSKPTSQAGKNAPLRASTIGMWK